MRKLSLCLIILSCAISMALAQNERVVMSGNHSDNSHDGKDIRVVESLTIQAPFSLKASTDGDWRAYSAPGVVNQTPPSLDQNFIRREAILVEGVTNETDIYELKVEEKSTTFQYFDGLGREIQSVMAEASPSRQDVIQAKSYDEYGRMEKEYLPYTNPANDPGEFKADALTEQLNFYNGTLKVTVDSKPWIQHVYEPSPLNRILETFGPGEAWQTGNTSTEKSTQFAIKTNAANTVKKWFINASDLPRWNSNYYEANKLLLTETRIDATTIDADDQIIQEYKDSRDLLILKRVKIASNDWLDTYYIYDDWGRVVMILPPVLSDIASPSSTNVDQLAFRYVYDSKGRIKQKRLPGQEEWHYMVYDKWDRLAMTQDPNQNGSYYLLTKYDYLNRPVMVSKYNTSQDADYWSTTLASKTVRYESRLATNKFGYTTNMSPSSSNENNIYQVTYYDDYDFVNYTNWDEDVNDANAFDFVSESGFTGIKFDNVKGQTTGSKVKVLGRSDHIWLNTVTYYDDKYRVLQSITENIRGGVERVTFEYDFADRVLKSKHVQTNDGGVTVLKDFEYDHAGRLLRVWHTIDNQEKVLMVENEFNALGELVDKNLHSTDGGNSFLQSIDHRYNIRGWLTHINNSTLSVDANNNDDNDLFGSELMYTDAFTVNNNNIKARYDGNISAIQWKTNNLVDAPKQQIFGYDYDQANRLLEARYASENNGNWTGDGGDYDVTIDGYDKNGNISGLTREGNGQTIDDLTYGYKNNGNSNRLDYVSESQSASNVLGFTEQYTLADEYDYDANGNMIVDGNKDISNIEYNHLNLPTEVVWTDSKKIKFQYDAVGIKLRKEVYDAGNNLISETDYTTMAQFQDQELEFLFTDEGRALKKGTQYDYEYFLKDHLGNIRVAFGMLTEVDHYQATMETANTTLKNQEESIFDNLAGSTRISTPINGVDYNRTDVSALVPNPNTVVSVLNGVGPSLMLPVTQGDQLEISVYAGYPISDANNGGVDGTGSFAATVASAFGAVAGGETQHIFDAFDNFAPILGAAGGGGSSAPRGYLNYIVFNSDYTDAHYGMIQMPSSAHETMVLLESEITAAHNGFAYIYVANESDAGTADIFFDELNITHTKANQSLQVTQSNDFYPFGMKMQPSSYQHLGQTVNDYNFQEQEQISDHNLNWHQFKWRNHDPSIGRFFNVDPLAEDYEYNSTYAFSENKLTAHIELEGLESSWAWLKYLSNYFERSPSEAYTVSGTRQVLSNKAAYSRVESNQSQSQANSSSYNIMGEIDGVGLSGSLMQATFGEVLSIESYFIQESIAYKEGFRVNSGFEGLQMIDGVQSKKHGTKLSFESVTFKTGGNAGMRYKSVPVVDFSTTKMLRSGAKVLANTGNLFTAYSMWQNYNEYSNGQMEKWRHDFRMNMNALSFIPGAGGFALLMSTMEQPIIELNGTATGKMSYSYSAYPLGFFNWLTGTNNFGY